MMSLREVLGLILAPRGPIAKQQWSIPTTLTLFRGSRVWRQRHAPHTNAAPTHEKSVEPSGETRERLERDTTSDPLPAHEQSHRWALEGAAAAATVAAPLEIPPQWAALLDRHVVPAHLDSRRWLTPAMALLAFKVKPQAGPQAGHQHHYTTPYAHGAGVAGTDLPGALGGVPVGLHPPALAPQPSSEEGWGIGGGVSVPLAALRRHTAAAFIAALPQSVQEGILRVHTLPHAALADAAITATGRGPTSTVTGGLVLDLSDLSAEALETIYGPNAGPLLTAAQKEQLEIRPSARSWRPATALELHEALATHQGAAVPAVPLLVLSPPVVEEAARCGFVVLLNAQEVTDPFVVDPTLRHRHLLTGEPFAPAADAFLTSALSLRRYRSLRWLPVTTTDVSSTGIAATATAAPMPATALAQQPHDELSSWVPLHGEAPATVPATTETVLLHASQLPVEWQHRIAARLPPHLRGHTRTPIVRSGNGLWRKHPLLSQHIADLFATIKSNRNKTHLKKSNQNKIKKQSASIGSNNHSSQTKGIGGGGLEAHVVADAVTTSSTVRQEEDSPAVPQPQYPPSAIEESIWIRVVDIPELFDVARSSTSSSSASSDNHPRDHPHPHDDPHPSAASTSASGALEAAVRALAVAVIAHERDDGALSSAADHAAASQCVGPAATTSSAPLSVWSGRVPDGAPVPLVMAQRTADAFFNLEQLTHGGL